jgi:hypothetical protein
MDPMGVAVTLTVVGVGMLAGLTVRRASDRRRKRKERAARRVSANIKRVNKRTVSG